MLFRSRFITVRVDEDRKKADKIRAKREARSAKRASFRKTEETTEATADSE